jgi:hypothetical protein
VTTNGPSQFTYLNFKYTKEAQINRPAHRMSSVGMSRTANQEIAEKVDKFLALFPRIVNTVSVLNVYIIYSLSCFYLMFYVLRSKLYFHPRRGKIFLVENLEQQKLTQCLSKC